MQWEGGQSETMAWKRIKLPPTPIVLCRYYDALLSWFQLMLLHAHFMDLDYLTHSGLGMYLERAHHKQERSQDLPGQRGTAGRRL